MAKQNETGLKKTKKVAGGNIVDYIRWRGDLSFKASPWGEIDGVITTMIAYANFGENELVFGSGQAFPMAALATSDLLTRLPQDGIGDSVQVRNQFLIDLANSRRFQDVVILDQVNDVDPARNIQFSAVTLDVPDVGNVVAFRGTDPTPVGWKEDFMMSYMTPVPAQTASLKYLERAAANTLGPLYLTGHSKGGNLALYAAAHTAPEIQDRIRAIYSFDGPGLDDETIASEGYLRIQPLIHSIVPHGSIVGMLMNYYPTFRVVQSSAASILQHDPFSWQLLGRRFLEEDSVSEGSRIMDRTIHEWLNSCSAEQREIFITTIFSMLDRKDKDTEKAGDDRANELLKKADDEAGRIIHTLISRLVSIHASVSWDTNIRQRLVLMSDSLRLRLKAYQGELIRSDDVVIDNHGKGFPEAVAEAEKMAEKCGLDRKDALHLVLFTEEMLSMARVITGEMEATFWIECVNREFELQLSTRTEMDRKKKKRLKASARPIRTRTGRSFQETLGATFERAMASDTDQVCMDLANAERGEDGAWDGFERSILLQLADNVRIAVHGKEVRMTVRKTFEE